MASIGTASAKDPVKRTDEPAW